MIEAIVGYQGSGKTFLLVNKADKALRRGQKVFSNVAIRGAYRLTFDDLVNYTFPKHSMVLIDEAGRYFNARKWKELPDDVFDLFTLERHLKLDLTIAVQNFNRIDKSLREVIELVWWARNLPFSPFFIYEGYYDVEHLGLKGEVQQKRLIYKRSRSRKLYDTHGMASTINKDMMPEIPWDLGEEKSVGIKNWIKKLFIAKSTESIKESPDNSGECLACEVDPNPVPLHDQEVSEND